MRGWNQRLELFTVMGLMKGYKIISIIFQNHFFIHVEISIFVMLIN